MKTRSVTHLRSSQRELALTQFQDPSPKIEVSEFTFTATT